MAPRKRLVAGFLLAAIIFYLLLRRVDAQQVWTVLRQANWLLLPVAMLMSCASVYLKGERWAVALGGRSGERPRRRVFAATMIGTAANYLLPARLGDVLRALVLRKHNDVPATRGLLASWSSQAFDMLAVAVLLLIGAAAGQGVASGPTIVLVLVVVVAGVALAGYLARRPERLAALARKLPGKLGAKIAPLVEHAASGLSFLGEPAVLARVVLFTIAVWSIEVMAAWLALQAFHVNAGLAAAGLLVAAIGLSFALPLTPGNVGTYQVITILVLGRFGVERDRAFAYGVGYQAFALVTTVALGFALFQREGLSWRGVAEQTAVQVPEQPADRAPNQER